MRKIAALLLMVSTTLTNPAATHAACVYEVRTQATQALTGLKEALNKGGDATQVNAQMVRDIQDMARNAEAVCA